MYRLRSSGGKDVRDSSMPRMKAKGLEATERVRFQPICTDNRPDKEYTGFCKNWLEPLFRAQTQQRTILKWVNAHFQTRSELLAWIETVKTAHTPRALDCVLSRWAANQLWAFISSNTHTHTQQHNAWRNGRNVSGMVQEWIGVFLLQS